MLQINVNAKNINNVAIIPTLYVVVISEGTFTIEGLGKASTNIGVISSQDILDAKMSPFVNYRDIEEVNGGNFLSGLVNFGKDVLDKAKDVNKFLKDSKIISSTLGVIPHPYAKAAAPIASEWGYGDMDMGSGVMVGGKHMSRAELKRRAMRN